MSTHKQLSQALFGLAFCAALAACESEGFIEKVQVGGAPVPLEGALLYAQQSDREGEAFIVDVSRERPRITSQYLPAGQVRSVSRPGSHGREAVVLTGGRSANPAQGTPDPVPSTLLLFNREGELFRKSLDGRYSELTLSADGRIAIAHGRGPDAGVDVGNTVAIVDLAQPNLAPHKVALSDNAGRAADSFVFSGANEGRRLLVARGADAMSILELDHLDRRPKEVPIRAGKIIFRPEEMFVQVAGGREVVVLQLVPEATGQDAFAVRPLSLATASNVQDIELIREGGPDRRLIALGQNKVSVIDPITGDAQDANTGAAYADLIRFTGRSPVDEELRERGLLIPLDDSRIAFVEFTDNAAWTGDSVETLNLPKTIGQVIPLEHHRLIVLSYAGGDLALVDLDARRVTPISTDTPVKGWLLDESETTARLWLNLENGRVARVDLLGLSAVELSLNVPADALFMLEGTPRKVAAVRNAEGGFVTLLDPDEPSRATARELVSFFYSDILD